LLLQCVQDGLRMAGNLDLAPLGADHAVGTDEEGAALHADELAAVELLGADHVEGLAQALVRIAHQREAEALLRAEIVVRLHRVARDAEHLGAALAELRQQRVEVQALGGAAGGGILWVEIEDQPLAGMVGEGGGGAAGQGQRHRQDRFGELLADGDHAQDSIPQNFIGSMMASRFRWSQNSRKSSRNAAMCMSAGMPMVTWAVNISAPVCIAR